MNSDAAKWIDSVKCKCQIPRFQVVDCWIPAGVVNLMQDDRGPGNCVFYKQLSHVCKRYTAL